MSTGIAAVPHLGDLIYRCELCGAWRLPAAYMRTEHQCERCPHTRPDGQRCTLRRAHMSARHAYEEAT